MNEATVKITGVDELLTGSDFWLFYWASNGARVYQEVFAKDLLLIHHLLRHKRGKLTVYLTDPFIKMIKGMSWELYYKRYTDQKRMKQN
jgi:hypothetical protein